MSSFLDHLKKEPLLSYGGVGSLLMERGFDLTGCLGQWLLQNPDELKWMTRQYLEAGCRILATAGSQCGPWKLEPLGLQNEIVKMNREVTRIVKDLVPSDCYVVASILPTGRMLKPLGALEPQEVLEAYKDEALGYVQGDADILWVMTMSDIEEACLGVQACKEVSDLPVMASMSFKLTAQGPRTMMGVDPKTAAERLSQAGADIIGHNCGEASPKEASQVMHAFSQVTEKPLVCRPNAGIPQVVEGRAEWPSTPEDFAQEAVHWLESGTRVIGGCCGSTPVHSRAMAKVLADY